VGFVPALPACCGFRQPSVGLLSSHPHVIRRVGVGPTGKWVDGSHPRGRVVVSFALLVSSSMLSAFVLSALASSLGSHFIVLVRVARVGLSSSLWPSFRRRWAAASLLNCRGGAWLGSGRRLLCVVPFVHLFRGDGGQFAGQLL
jgi:hypothetical protein